MKTLDIFQVVQPHDTVEYITEKTDYAISYNIVYVQYIETQFIKKTRCDKVHDTY